MLLHSFPHYWLVGMVTQQNGFSKEPLQCLPMKSPPSMIRSSPNPNYKLSRSKTLNVFECMYKEYCVTHPALLDSISPCPPPSLLGGHKRFLVSHGDNSIDVAEVVLCKDLRSL